jgi:hypothetical protein
MSIRRRTYGDDAALETAVSELLRRFDAISDFPAGAGAAAAFPGAGDEPAFYVAAGGATDESKAVAHFICDREGDEVEIQAALDALLLVSVPVGPGQTRGRVVLSEGIFNIDGAINIPKGVHLQGSGQTATILYDDGDANMQLILDHDAEASDFGLSYVVGL